jgi:tRNA-dihydrouridine synthase 3
MIDFAGRRILAPLTKGGNLPFRRLCVEFGAEITLSEMAYARQVIRRTSSELALLRRHPSERCFGVQLAAGRPDEALRAATEAVERGASFVDLNAGCPIHDVVRRGMGATLLLRPKTLARLVETLAPALPVPVTVKIRSGWCESDVNALEVARAVEAAGAAALTVHARTREQRYTKSADWGLIGAIAAAIRIPVIGNGDVLTWYEAEEKLAAAGCAAVMLARGALIKPWLFQELAERRELVPTAVERIAIYHRLAGYMKEHFRDDAKGRERAMRFLPWHLDFFARWRPWPEADWRERSRLQPLLQTRRDDGDAPELLERVLRDPRPEVHARIAAALWEAGGAGEAGARCAQIGAELPPIAADAGEIATAHG